MLNARSNNTFISFSFFGVDKKYIEYSEVGCWFYDEIAINLELWGVPKSTKSFFINLSIIGKSIIGNIGVSIVCVGVCNIKLAGLSVFYYKPMSTYLATIVHSNILLIEASINCSLVDWFFYNESFNSNKIKILENQ